MMKKTLTLVFSGAMGIFLPSSVSADLNCAAAPDCASLGYTKTEEDCADSVKVACPTDTSKVFCSASVQPITCAVGSILGSDQLCYADKLPKGVKPVGIVFDTTNKLAVALTDINSSGSANSTSMYWSSSSCDTPGLDNCTSSGDLLSCGADGRTNTNAILASTCNGTTYAANGANAYEPSGCSKDFCKKTKWFLPSMRDLITLYNTKSYVNASLSLTASSGAKTLTGNYYWSSTEYSKNNAWRLGMIDGDKHDAGKYLQSSFLVRPVVYYGEEKEEIKAGAILYGDGTVASGLVTGKTPIGVVFDPVERLAVALTDVKEDGSAGSTTMRWSSSYCDTPNLDNCAIVTSCMGDYCNDIISCGVDGRTNTNAILAASTCNGTTYAANGANAYEPSGCSKDFCKKTKWFLPSIKELAMLSKAKSYVNASLILTASSGAKTLTESYYWSSTEYNIYFMWGYFFQSDSGKTASKELGLDQYYVRPVIKY